jgi:hypothetical protein
VLEPPDTLDLSSGVNVPTAAAKPAKKSRLPALSGLRAFAALNIVFYHFSNPKWFGPFAPIVDNGYTSVSFFLLMSGFILAYNYSDRAQSGHLNTGHFWIARFSCCCRPGFQSWQPSGIRRHGRCARKLFSI